MTLAPLTALSLLMSMARAQGDLPGPPAPDLVDPAEHAAAPFGSDVSLEVGAASLLGSWAVPGVHSAVGLRFEAFTVGADHAGPRLGLSLFGAAAMGALQRAEELQGEEAVDFPFSYLHFGALCVLRSDPALPWGGTAGLGFSRMDLDPYYGGSYPVPWMLFEGGARRHLGRAKARSFLDVGLRVGWTQVREPSEALAELWLLQLSIGLGIHVR